MTRFNRLDQNQKTVTVLHLYSPSVSDKCSFVNYTDIVRTYTVYSQCKQLTWSSVANSSYNKYDKSSL